MIWIEQRRPGQEQVLLVLHQAHSSPGRVGMMLQQMGYALDIRRPPLGHELPLTLSDHAGVVIFGGPMSANDDSDFIKREIDWIGVALREDKPFFGICLGAQMLVRHLGGTVCGHGDGVAEIGYYPLRPTEAGARLIHWPAMAYQWHREGFSLPHGASLLAEGEAYPHQAIRYGRNAYGVQFHPELTYAMMNRWTVRGAHRLTCAGAQERRRHVEGRFLYEPAMGAWLLQFLHLWLGRSTGRMSGPSSRKTPAVLTA